MNYLSLNTWLLLSIACSGAPAQGTESAEQEVPDTTEEQTETESTEEQTVTESTEGGADPEFAQCAPMDEAQARQHATELANEAFAARGWPGAQEFPDVHHTFAPADFTWVACHEGRWSLRDEPPAGAFAEVSFDGTGSSPELRIGYANQ